jgi:glycosyltransferase involved in cell wall biosynthesis
VLISVIVPAFNEERLITESLRHVGLAMEAIARRWWDSELIVCDNNSTDRTPELARAAGARVVFEPVNQIARARNCGARAATGDWFIFIDADSQPSPELFEEIAEHIQSDRCLGGGCTLRLEGNHVMGKLLTGVWNLVSRMGRLMAGSCVFCEAKAFREVGGFSNDLFAGEELDLSKRLKKHARRVGKQIVILHRHPLLTSARKLDLYTPREYLRFIAKAALLPRKVLTSRAECHPWYDGRR